MVRAYLVGSCVLLGVTGCAFQGLNSLPLPGAVGRGPGATTYRVEVANVGTLEANSPVLLNDVVVGSVGNLTFRDWHADVLISVKPNVVVPANAVARVGQTSLLGSMHLELNSPLGEAPRGRLQSGATIPLDRSATYPSTEQTLSSLSAVINGGGLGQIGDIIHNFGAALSGHESQVRDLLTRFDDFVGTLDAQRDNLIGFMEELNRLTGTLAGQRDVITQALRKIPPALDVLIAERPRITTALDKLRVFSDTATGLVDDTQADLVRNLKNLEPAIKALADIGPDLGTALAYAPTFPYGQNLIDRGVRGDYMNMYLIADLTLPRLKRTLLLGTRWGQPGARLVPAPGDPSYLNYTYAPPGVGATPPPASVPTDRVPAPAPTPDGVSQARPLSGIPLPTDFPPKDEAGG
ncbi:MCE family protein [Mycobacterium sp. SP-6446]|uniref:MCE family protein n=1 Tax=Mycobacterium sp. SP-6446 TaxID=1834162 RepID=UPI00096FDD50|nr:MCE family protein [Mycobacterium sp. SP-6446]OMC15810.1 mammalian cell entry protein [Mycobacterium sp. SP-6446]